MESCAAHVFFAGFFSLPANAYKKLLVWHSGRHHNVSVLFQVMSESEDCLVVETTILPDKKWLETLDKKELDYFKKNQIPFEELEDQKVVCTACFKQGNHKQKVHILRSFRFFPF